MAVSDAVERIHRWVVALPKLVYGVLLAYFSISWVLALLLATVPDPIYGNRVIWAVDLAILTAFAVSHIRYRLRRRTHGEFR